MIATAGSSNDNARRGMARKSRRRECHNTLGRIKLEAPVNRVPATVTITMTLHRARITSRQRTDVCTRCVTRQLLMTARIDTNNIYRAVSSPDKSAKLRYELSLSAATSNETHGRSTRDSIKRGRIDIERSQIKDRKYLKTIYKSCGMKLKTYTRIATLIKNIGNKTVI